MTIEYLKFDENYVGPLLYGNKCITVRPPDEIGMVKDGRWRTEELERGDEVKLITPDDTQFGSAVINKISTMTIREFVDYRLDGHKTYHKALAPNWRSTDSERMASELEKYYPGRQFEPHNTVAVVWLEQIEEVE